MKTYWLWLLVLSLSLAGCGARDERTAQGPSPADPAAATATAPPAAASPPIADPALPADAAPAAATTVALPMTMAGLTVPERQPGEALLREVWPPPTDPPSRYLYLMTPYAPGDSVFTVYDIQTGTTHTLPIIPSSRDLSGGQLSPDGQWLVYGERKEQNSGDLILVRSDGTEAQDIADHVGMAGSGRCENYMAWSPDNQRLAYMRYADGYWQLAVVPRAQPLQATVVLTSTFMKFLGWMDATHVLAGIYLPGHPLNFVAVESTTGQRRFQIEPPTDGGGMGCGALSADGQFALLDLLSGVILLDTQTQQLRPSPAALGLISWRAGTTAAVAVPQNERWQHRTPARMLSSVTPLVTHTLRLLPAPPPGVTYRWDFPDTAPDGRFLALCQAASAATGTPQDEKSFLLYNIAQHQWRVIASGCPLVLGWQP